MGYKKSEVAALLGQLVEGQSRHDHGFGYHKCSFVTNFQPQVMITKVHVQSRDYLMHREEGTAVPLGEGCVKCSAKQTVPAEAQHKPEDRILASAGALLICGYVPCMGLGVFAGKKTIIMGRCILRQVRNE